MSDDLNKKQDWEFVEKNRSTHKFSILNESWEVGDASGFFPEYMHANKVTKIDRPDNMQKVEPPEAGEQFGEPNSQDEQEAPQDGDSYCEAQDDQGHHDNIYEMEAGPEDTSSSSDDRELKADKEEDLRTEKDEAKAESQSGNDASEAASENADAENQSADTESSDNKETQQDQEPSEPQESEGAEDPIQKESEGIDEVAEATSKISEDVHGGDEATKDIEDSPNAANDGKNQDNQGAEKGQDGQEGEGDEGQGDTQSNTNEQGEDGGEGGTGQGEDGETEAQADQEGEGQGGTGQSESADQGDNQTPSSSDDFEQNNFAASEDWEGKADNVAWAERMEQELKSWSEHERSELSGGGGRGVDYSGYNEWKPEDAKTIFFKVRELLTKLVSQQDPSKKVKGSSKWWLEQVVKEATSFQHHKIPKAKFDRPMKNNVVFFVDISGSVSSLAELFMALMGGAAGLPGVNIVVGSEAHAESEITVDRPFKNVEQAMAYFRKALSGETANHEMGSNAIVRDAWYRPYDHPFEPGVIQYLKDKNLFNANTTCLFFGDMQGVHFNLSELKKIVRTCRCLWLFTDGPGHHTHRGDLPIAVEAKLPIVYNVQGAQQFLTAVRRIRHIRPGMSIIP